MTSHCKQLQAAKLGFARVAGGAHCFASPAARRRRGMSPDVSLSSHFASLFQDPVLTSAYTRLLVRAARGRAKAHMPLARATDLPAREQRTRCSQHIFDRDFQPFVRLESAETAGTRASSLGAGNALEARPGAHGLGQGHASWAL